MPFYDDEGDGYRGDGYRYPRRQHSPPLHTEKIVTERKIFFLDLKENDRGRVLKITEDVRGRRDTIMVPVEALRDFIDALHRIDDANNGAVSESRAEAED
ncbi:MAG: hypothetical protein ACR2OZ_10675 [Verrucomicrobiales bacterium]